jgi:hypothetical protein
MSEWMNKPSEACYAFSVRKRSARTYLVRKKPKNPGKKTKNTQAVMEIAPFAVGIRT